MTLPIFLALDEAHFRMLVSGKAAVITTNGGQEVRIILSDIGWIRMLGAVTEAWSAAKAAGYIDPAYPERNCDHCGKLYRGPAVYCSHVCAVADA